LDKSVVCPKCEKEVETVWKFSRERCKECSTPLDENPVRIGFLFMKDNNRAVVESMIQDGTLSFSDLKD
jgi:predicted amidophosphoribosyltransferase